MNQPDEQIAALRAQLVSLQQENTELKLQLSTCQSDLRLQNLEQHNTALQRRDPEVQRNDRLFEAIAQATNALLTISDFDRAVNTALQILGEALETDRVKILECVFDDPSNLFPAYYTMSYEWITAGTISQLSHPSSSRISSHGAEGFMKNILQGNGFGGLLQAWPESFWNAFEAVQAKGIYCVSIRVEGQNWGVLVYDDCQEAKHRNLSELAVLKTIADCIGNAIQRQRTQQALLQAEQERVAELAKASEALKRSLDSLASEPSLDKFLGHMLKVIAEQLNAPLTEYWYHPEPHNIAYVGLAYWQGQILRPEEQPGHIGAFGYPVPPEMIHQESLHHRRSCFITDDIATSGVHTRIAHEYGLDAASWYAQHGVSRFLNVPLILGDKTIGALIVFVPSDHHFTEQQVELTYALAQQVTLAIQLTRLAEEAKQAAIAREQERAAQAQLTELKKVNDALKRSLDALATDPDLDHFVGHVLKVIAEQFSAPVVEYWSTTRHTATLELSCWDGNIITNEQLGDDPRTSGIVIPPAMADYQLLNQRHRHFVTDDLPTDPIQLEVFTPLNFDLEAWCRAQGVRRHLNVPLNLGNRTIGALGVYIPGDRTFTQEQIELGYALAQQVTLAIRLTQMAEAEKQTAVAKLNQVIAREQEKAARERAAELAKANEALKRSVDVLATETDLNQFIGHVLRLAAEQFDAPLVEYWQVTNPNLAKIVGWWGHDRIHGFGQEHDHPAKETVVQVPPYMVEGRQFSNRCNHFVAPFEHSVEPAGGEFSNDPATWYASFNVYWQLNLPLIVGKTCFGVLNFWQPRDRPLTEQQIELGYALTQQVTLAIRLTQLAEEAKQAAIAREQEQAATERAAELAKANEALRRNVERMASDRRIETLVSAFLTEAIATLGADAAAIMLRTPNSLKFTPIAVVVDGHLLSPAELAADPYLSRYVEFSSADIDGIFSTLARGETPTIRVDELREVFPEAYTYHQQLGHRIIWHTPLRLQGEVIGFTGITLREDRPPSNAKRETITALAQQLTLALELTSLADESQQAAIAREQEKAEAAEQAAVLEERNRMARELHDTLAQGFTGIVMQLEGVENHLIQDLALVRRRVNRACQLARDSLTEARRSVQALRAPILEANDLATALSRLVEQIVTDTAINVHVQTIGTPIPLPTALENELLRIGQEALTNVFKHANATQVQSELTFNFQGICLSVTDDGRGFDVDYQYHNERIGFGLMGMQERTERLGGYIEVVSQLGQGTKVTATIPY